MIAVHAANRCACMWRFPARWLPVWKTSSIYSSPHTMYSKDSAPEFWYRQKRPKQSTQGRSVNRNDFQFSKNYDHGINAVQDSFSNWEKEIIEAPQDNEYIRYSKKENNRFKSRESDIADYMIESDIDMTNDLMQLEDRYARKKFEDRTNTKKQRRHNYVSGYDNYGLEGRSKKKSATQDFAPPNVTGEVVFGLFSSLLALQNRECVACVFMKDKLKGRGGVVEQIVDCASERNVQVEYVSGKILDALSRGRPHQGVCVDVSRKRSDLITDVQELMTKQQPQLALFLDAIQDPMNFGAILRGAYYMGVDHVVISGKDSCSLTPVVSKASAGAMELMNVYASKDTVNFLKSCASHGWKVLGTVGPQHESDRVSNLSEIKVQQDTIVIIGNEGSGLSDEVLEVCDELVTIPGVGNLHPAVDSLNVSVASGIILNHLTNSRKAAGNDKSSLTIRNPLDVAPSHPMPSNISLPPNTSSDLTISREVPSKVIHPTTQCSEIAYTTNAKSDVMQSKSKPFEISSVQNDKTAIVQTPKHTSDITNLKSNPTELSALTERPSSITQCKQVRNDIIVTNQPSSETQTLEKEDVQDYILSQTEVSYSHMTPEIGLHLITPSCDLWWGRGEDCLLPDPFWAFYWPGGQALTRFILDNSDLVSGKAVFDIGSGCGASAIAAAVSGAKLVCANDICPVALKAVEMNAKLNNVQSLNLSAEDHIGQNLDKWDIVLLGDMFYDQEFTDKVSDWLIHLHESGKSVFIGDPGRVFFLEHPVKSRLCEVGCYELSKQAREENNGLTHARVWTFTQQK